MCVGAVGVHLPPGMWYQGFRHSGAGGIVVSIWAHSLCAPASPDWRIDVSIDATP